MPAAPLPAAAVDEIRRAYAETRDRREAARRTGRDPGTVLKYTRDMGPPRGGPRPDAARRRCHELLAAGLSTREVARRLRAEGFDASSSGVQNWAKEPLPEGAEGCRGVPDCAGPLWGGPALSPHPPVGPASLPDPDPEVGGPSLPESEYRDRPALQVDTQGWWLVSGDQHLPVHDRATIEASVDEARRQGAVGVLLNGDVMDMMGVSPFFRPFTKTRLVDELEVTREFLRWLRSRLPRARLVWRQGNHEFRLVRYIADRAEMLRDLPALTLPELLNFRDFGVEWVEDKRKVMLGKLATLHGHELRKGEGVNPARFAFLRTSATVLVSHFHRTSEHHQRALDDKHLAAWSIGCACCLHPDYDPYGQSNHGYAMVRLESDGWFSVHNRRVLNGRAV